MKTNDETWDVKLCKPDSRRRVVSNVQKGKLSRASELNVEFLATLRLNLANRAASIFPIF